MFPLLSYRNKEAEFRRFGCGFRLPAVLPVSYTHLNRDDVNPDLFFFTMPEEMEKSAKRHGFSKMKNLGTDFFITMSIVNAMSNKKFEWMRPLLDQMTEYESCTGMSNHAILVC